MTYYNISAHLYHHPITLYTIIPIWSNYLVKKVKNLCGFPIFFTSLLLQPTESSLIVKLQRFALSALAKINPYIACIFKPIYYKLKSVADAVQSYCTL